jgi:CspA family cold shock protein
MSTISKSFSVALIITVIIAIPVLLIDFQYSDSLVLIATFLISLISGLVAGSNKKARKKEPVEEHRTPYNQSRRESGNVKWFNASKGFGFITRDTGDDIFVHFRSIRGEGHRVLHDGQRVEFAISEGDKGLQAEDVAASN